MVCVLAVAAGSAASTTTTEGSSPSGSESPTASGSSSGSAQVRDLSAAQESSEGVEVSTFGTATVRPYQNAENPPAVLAVHGVQRVDGATVVYFSAGYADDGAAEPDPAGLNELSGPGSGNGGYTSGGSLGSVRVVDVENATTYRTVVLPSSDDASVTVPFGSLAGAFPDEPGLMGAMYAVLPELPESARTVDVALLWGVVVRDVPVREGYLEPAVEGDEVIPLGTGWPAVDEAEVAGIDAAAFTYPLAAVTEALDDSLMTTETGETVSIELAADVLFAFDRADLSPTAQATIAQVARELVADGAAGQVSVVGHTDDQGSDAYNLDLSQRRAQAVAAVLQPALAGVSPELAVEGRGEAEPIADNGSAEGQQANRRVTITYTQGG